MTVFPAQCDTACHKYVSLMDIFHTLIVISAAISFYRFIYISNLQGIVWKKVLLFKTFFKICIDLISLGSVYLSADTTIQIHKGTDIVTCNMSHLGLFNVDVQITRITAKGYLQMLFARNYFTNPNCLIIMVLLFWLTVVAFLYFASDSPMLHNYIICGCQRPSI